MAGRLFEDCRGPQAMFTLASGLGDAGKSRNALHVLTLTPFYPHAQYDAGGCFVAEPLQAFAGMGLKSSVIAVQPTYRPAVTPSATVPSAIWVRYPALPSNFGLSSSGYFLFARLLPHLRRMHSSDPIDLIHAHAALPCGHAAALLGRELKIPFVVTVHGLDAFSTNQARGMPGRWCQRVSRMVYREARQVICISEKVRDQVIQGASGAVHTTVVYNGADPLRFFPPKDPKESHIVLSVGTLIPIKGHDQLLRALSRIRRDDPRVSCQIIGEGPERHRLEALVHALKLTGHVRFLRRQNRSQTAEAMRQCSVFALPSHYEGLGCVYLEAMACERAVIACRGQGIEEVIEHGANGWLVEPNDQDGLAEALSFLLGNLELRRQLGTAARRTILRGFTLAHQSARLAQLYRESAA